MANYLNYHQLNSWLLATSMTDSNLHDPQHPPWLLIPFMTASSLHEYYIFRLRVLSKVLSNIFESTLKIIKIPSLRVLSNISKYYLWKYSQTHQNTIFKSTFKQPLKPTWPLATSMTASCFHGPWLLYLMVKSTLKSTRLLCLSVL